MRKSGILIIGLGLAGQLFASTFYAITNIFELYVSDWYTTAGKATSLIDALTAFMLLLGFILFAMTLFSPHSLRLEEELGSLAPHPSLPQRSPSAEDRLSMLQSLSEAGHLTSEELLEQRAKVLESL